MSEVPPPSSGSLPSVGHPACGPASIRWRLHSGAQQVSPLWAWCAASPVPLQGALRRVVAAQSRVTNRLTIEQWPAVLQRCSSSKNTDGASRCDGSFPFGVGWVAGGASDEDPLSSHCSAPASGDEPSAELAPVGGPPHPPEGHAGRPLGMRDRSSEASGTVLRAMPRVGRAARQYSEWPASQPASQPASCMLQPLSILHT